MHMKRKGKRFQKYEINSECKVLMQTANAQDLIG